MNEKYWDRVADDYDNRIFDTLKNDRKGTIRRYINRFSSGKTSAYDFGCGVGKYLPVLRRRFDSIHAIDLSSRCIEIAKKTCQGLNNITFLKHDLSDPHFNLEKKDFAVSVNVLIMPSYEIRSGILSTISRHLVKDANLLLVAPSLESALYSNFRLQEWNRKSSKNHRDKFYFKFNGNNSSVIRGVLNWADRSTKHYLEAELRTQLAAVGLEVIAVDKVEYSWASMFDTPPNWMQHPYPWDWLTVSRKQ